MRRTDGKAGFVRPPQQGEHGHALFALLPWQPKVGEFIDAVGFPVVSRKAP